MSGVLINCAITPYVSGQGYDFIGGLKHYLNVGVFLISLDFEGCYGNLDHFGALNCKRNVYT